MYTFYYINRNLQTGVIKVENPNEPIRIPEDLIFCNLRIGTKFEREPIDCIDFTDVERLIMNSEFTDTQMLKESDFRLQNSLLDIICQVDFDLPYFNVIDFNFDVDTESGEGYRVSFNKDTPIDKLKIRFKYGNYTYETEVLSYYLTEKPEFNDVALLVMYDEKYHFKFDRISQLVDELGVPLITELSFFEVTTDKISESFSLDKFKPCAIITHFDAELRRVYFEFRADLVTNVDTFILDYRYANGDYYSFPVESSDSYVQDSFIRLLSGDSFKIIHPANLWKNSNTIVVP